MRFHALCTDAFSSIDMVVQHGRSRNPYDCIRNQAEWESPTEYHARITVPVKRKLRMLKVSFVNSRCGLPRYERCCIGLLNRNVTSCQTLLQVSRITHLMYDGKALMSEHKGLASALASTKFRHACNVPVKKKLSQCNRKALTNYRTHSYDGPRPSVLSCRGERLCGTKQKRTLRTCFHLS